MADPRITIEREDPRTPDVVALIEALDHYLNGLYPVESNHLVPIDELAAPDIAFFVARRERVAVACGALLRENHDWGEIKRIFVPPVARGLGLGRAILSRIEDAGRAMGLTTLRLETGSRQHEALRLFERAGYQRRGPFGAYPLGDPWSVFMEKTLAT